MKRQLATRGGRIECLVQTAEADAVLLQPRHPGDQILEGATKSVQPPDHQGILGSQEILELRQPRPLGHHATHTVHNDLRAARLPEGILLELEVLILRRHPRIADVHTRSLLNGRKLMVYSYFLHLVFLLCFLPTFWGKSNPKTCGGRSARNPPFSCPSLWSHDAAS